MNLAEIDLGELEATIRAGHWIDWPIPQTEQTLLGLIGLLGSYRNLALGFAQVNARLEARLQTLTGQQPH